jgi:hypothetical protein
MRQTILFTAAAATLRSLLASQHGQCQRPSPCCRGGNGPGRYVRNDEKPRSRCLPSTLTLFVRFLRSVVLPALSPGHHPGRSTIVPAGLGPAL